MRPKQARWPIRLPLNAAVAFLILASASLVEAQVLQTLCSFNGTNGVSPSALGLGSDGNFYGTTYSGGGSGGSIGCGTVFKMTTNGALTTLYSFTGGSDGAGPSALALGSDGNFYGMTLGGGSNGYGTMFKVTTNGTLTTLVSLDSTNGGCPYALTLGNDGNFYGTTPYGSISDQNNYGRVFKVTTNGSLTKLVFFNGTNGVSPSALALGSDGNFYGTTEEGGLTNSTDPHVVGTVFQVTTNGTLTTLVSFNGTNGAQPVAGVTLGNDGNFYGTTWAIDPSGYGTVFQVTTNGTLTTLASFNSSGGSVYPSALTLGSDGNFYGTTLFGGITNSANPSGMGTVFRLLLQLVITVQPQSQTNNAGATVTFSVVAASLSPMVYQWQRNGTNLDDGGDISGSTTDTLTITGISDSDAAGYSVIVSNSYASVTSSNATLTVNDSLFVASQPESQTVGVGSNVTFTATFYGALPLVSQWYFNGTPFGAPAAATRFASCTLTNVGTNQAGKYSVLAVNGYGSLMSSNAVLTVKVFPPSIELQPSGQTVVMGRSVSFTVSVNGTPPFLYQWQCNGANLLDATNAVYVIQAVSATNAGNYSVVVTNSAGSVTSSNALLTVISPPSIPAQPTNLLVLPGTNAVFGVSVSGTAPFGYQWQFYGTNLLNATNALCSIPSVGTNNAGNYVVVVTNLAGSATSSNAALTVVLSPASQTNIAGGTSTFTATAFSPESLNYQWQKNGTNLVEGGHLSGTTNSTLTIAGVSDVDAASYSAVVSDAYASVTTSNAVLTVIDPPTLALQLWAGYPLLNLYGMLSNNFVVQYSTNLAATNWVNLLSLTNLPSSPYLFLDPAGDAEPARFYRAFMQ